MKNLFRPLVLAFLAMTVISNKCEKIDSTPKLDGEGLPYATQTGANTFGCLINGESWFVYQKFPYQKTCDLNIINLLVLLN